MLNLQRYPSPLHDDLDYLLDNLRPADAFELGCSGASREDYHRILEHSTLDHVWTIDGDPVFAFGIIRAGHIGHLWGFGTTKTRRVIPAATRWGLKVWLPDAFEKHGLRRIEVRVPTKSTAAISWLRSLGMTVECADIQHSSANGEPMVQLAYTLKEFNRDYVLSPTSPDHSGQPYCGPDENQRGNSICC